MLNILLFLRNQRLVAATTIFLVILGLLETNTAKDVENDSHSQLTDHAQTLTSETSKVLEFASPDLQPTDVKEVRTRTNFSLAACVQGNSSDLNQCLRQVLQILKHHLSRGIPQINIPPMEPLEIQNVTFQQGSGAVRILSEFRDVEIRGISSFLLTDLRTDILEQTLSFDMVFPKLSVTGSYELSGNIFLFLIAGKGDFFCDLIGAKAHGISKLRVSRNGSRNQINVKKMDINLAVDNIKVHLTNLFNGDPVLGSVINNFLNENSQDVFDEVRPQIELQVGDLLSKLANLTLSAVST